MNDKKKHPGDNVDMFPDDFPAADFVFDKSPAGVAQRLRMLEALRQRPVTTFFARDELAILMPGARIFELKSLGYAIRTDKVKLQDSAGIWHNGMASYVLTGEPVEVAT